MDVEYGHVEYVLYKYIYIYIYTYMYTNSVYIFSEVFYLYLGLKDISVKLTVNIFAENYLYLFFLLFLKVYRFGLT